MKDFIQELKNRITNVERKIITDYIKDLRLEGMHKDVTPSVESSAKFVKNLHECKTYQEIFNASAQWTILLSDFDNAVHESLIEVYG